MKRFDLWKLSVLNVFSSPLRSMLTVLGFAIGVAAVMAVLTLGEAGRIRVQGEMERLGINRIWLTASDENGLPRGSGRWLKEHLSLANDELIYIPSILQTKDHENVPVTLVGCEAGFLEDAKLYAGRWLWPAEWREDSSAVLVGAEIASRYGIEAEDSILIGENHVRVCGLIGAKESVSTVQLEESIVVPIEVLCAESGRIVHEIQLSTPQELSSHDAQKIAVNALTRRGVSVTAQTMEVQMEAASSVLFTFINVLKWVAMICILVGGIGIMNILLISVRERQREIGVMKSMGTTSGQICALFLLEALVYGAIGGLLGILLGWGLIYAAGKAIELSAKVDFGVCALVLCGAVSTGILFGVAPAFRASSLKCVDALRQE